MEGLEEGFLPEVLTDLPAQKTTIVEVPRLPPLAVWHDHITDLEVAVGGYRCDSREEFEAGKKLRGRVTALNTQIEGGYSEVTRAIDAIKGPVLDKKKADLAKTANLLPKIDGPMQVFSRAEQAKADAKAREEAAERDRIAKEKQQAEAEMLKEWGDEKGAEEVASAPIIPSRPEPAKTGLSGARGSKLAPRLVMTIVDPDAVDRAYCAPVESFIKSKQSSYFKSIDKPTKEQIEAFEKLIGGIRLEWV